MTSLVLSRVTGLATIQDLGRRGFMHMGIPRGGALSPELLARANAAVCNEPNAPAIELVGAIVIHAENPVQISTEDGHVNTLGNGETWELRYDARPRYIAVRGGFRVPRALGGAGTLLVASFGGHEGRALKSGDSIAIDDARIHREDLRMPPDTAAPIAIVAGPDGDCFDDGIDHLLHTIWKIGARRDRVGASLEGGHIARKPNAPIESRPMVRGALQIPPSGEPIVLGPDHPTTGGYPVLAVITENDFGNFFARAPGARVSFVRAR